MTRTASPALAIASIVAALTLCLALCPAAALADDGTSTAETPATDTTDTETPATDAIDAGDDATADASVKKYRVIYKPNGGKLAKGTKKSQKVKAEARVKLAAAPTRDGYLFKGWLNSVTKKVKQPKARYRVRSRVVFTAQWEKVTAKLEVKTKMKGAYLARVSIKVDKDSTNVPGSVRYSTRNANKKWNQAEGGSWTKAASKGLRCVKAKLTGKLKDNFDLYYRIKIGDYGWMAWTKDGEVTGTDSYIDKFVRGFQAKLVAKTDKAKAKKIKTENKGNVSYAAKKKNLRKYAEHLLTLKAQDNTSSTKWCLVVDCHINFTGIFKGKKGNWKLDRLCRCVTGKPSTPTVKGHYTLGGKGLEFGHGYSCWYYSQIYSDYLFHSQPYWPGSKTSIRWKAMGSNSSHGCVRLKLENAKYIYDKVPYGTKIYIY